MKNINVIRRNWLVSLFIIYGFGFLSSVFVVFDRQYGKVHPDDLFESVLIALCGTLLVLGLTYYFAYEKRGIWLLMMQIIYIPFKALSDVIEFIKFPYATIDLIELAVTLTIYFYYWKNSLKLREINEEYQDKKTSRELDT